MVKTPCTGYERVDVGSGRSLERYGQVLVDRLSPEQKGNCHLPEGSLDWRFTADAAMHEWRLVSPHASGQWVQECLSAPLPMSLLSDVRKLPLRVSDIYRKLTSLKD